jgi:signal transduction histidine kinase
MLDRIAAHLQQNQEFTANAAHELRSPLAAIQNTLEVTLNADRSPDQYQMVLAELLEECGYLRVLVNQLLLLSESDVGRLVLAREPLGLDQLVLRSVEMFQGVAEASGVTLQADRLEAVQVRGDANRLRQVVNNLLDNAVKFTSAPGTIRVEVRQDAAANMALLRVVDTGAGIAPADLPHIFERFYRGDKARDRERHVRGTGLGLSICQSIIAGHGGTIEVASTLGAGTTFTVRLPAEEATAASKEPAARASV